MVVGHTKFTPDSCFGLLKQRFRRTHVQCLADLERVVNISADVNHAKLVGNEQGEVFVPVYDWLSYFADHLKKITGIKKFHQFIFTSANNNSVECKHFTNSPSQKVTMCKDQAWHPSQFVLPPTIDPKGLSEERQWYLYDKIRPYCQEYAADSTCPLPSTPRLTGTPSPGRSPTTSNTNRGTRVCSKCGQTVHNIRTCDS